MKIQFQCPQCQCLVKRGPDLPLTMITGSKGGLETLGTCTDQFRDGEKEDPWGILLLGMGAGVGT